MNKLNHFTPLVIILWVLLVVHGRILVDELAGANNEIGQRIPVGRGAESEDSRLCEHIEGLPEPASGCCGVQFIDPLDIQLIESEDLLHQSHRLRRSSDSDILPSKMIKNGKATDIHGFPWTAYLYRKTRYNLPGLSKRRDVCGGTIITSRYVLTAAHCLNKFKNVSSQVLSQFGVMLAEYNTNTFPRDCVTDTKCIQNQKMSVERVIIHPQYNDSLLRNDIALVRLSSDIPYTEHIRPICLPTTNIGDINENTLVIAGWGRNGNTQSNLKQAAIVNYVTNKDCKDAYSFKDDSMACLVGENGEDACEGDSGGPVMAYSGDKYFLTGVVNGKRSTEPCGSSVPSLFNNVYYHKDWIVREINNDTK